jgi:hypothetical protein
MKLLDFPPEIFELIVHELVEDVGVWKAQKYLKVCSKVSSSTFPSATSY